MGYLIAAGVMGLIGAIAAKKSQERQYSFQQQMATTMYGPGAGAMIAPPTQQPVAQWGMGFAQQMGGAYAQRQYQMAQPSYGQFTWPGSRAPSPMYGAPFGGYPPSGMPGYYQYGMAPSAAPRYPPQQYYQPAPQYQMPAYPPSPQRYMPQQPPYYGPVPQTPLAPQGMGPGLNPLYYTGAY